MRTGTTIAIPAKILPSEASLSREGSGRIGQDHGLEASPRIDEMCHPLTQNGGITSLKGNSNGVLEKLLDNQLRGTSKFTVADAGGYTTDELPETIAHGASGFQDQWGEGG